MSNPTILRAQSVERPSTTRRGSGVRLGRKLADHDVYSVVFDPYDPDSAPVTGSLADDVVDFNDLQEEFAELRAGRVANAQWQWKFGFDHHWGKHAVEMIYALYHVRWSAFLMGPPGFEPGTYGL
jgi:hypothetical protein